MDGPKAYKFIGFGAMDGPKPYKFIGIGAMDGPKSYKFIGFGAIGPVIPGLPLQSNSATSAPVFHIVFYDIFVTSRRKGNINSSLLS